VVVRSSLWAALAPLLLTSTLACGGGSDDTISLTYADPLIEAPTRNVDLVAITSTSCDLVQSRLHSDIAQDSAVIAHELAKYPIQKPTILKSVPRNTTFVLDVIGLDSNLVQVSRGCSVVELGSGAAKISIELKSLPVCMKKPATLDIMIVLDTSTQMVVADPQLLHIDALLNDVLIPNAMLPNSTYGLITFGQGDPQELVPQTGDLNLMRNAINSARMLNQGAAHLYDGVVKAGDLLRARSVCGRRPAMMILAADADNGSTHHIEEAAIAVYGAQGDPTENIFSYGIGFDDPAYGDLTTIVPDGVGQVENTGAASSAIEMAIISARDAINGLVPH
jgi:hypothetical protein